MARKAIIVLLTVGVFLLVTMCVMLMNYVNDHAQITSNTVSVNAETSSDQDGHSARYSCHKELTDPGNWIRPATPDSLQDLVHTDRKLIQHICEKWLLPPFSTPRNLRDPNQLHYSQQQQSEYVDKLLNGKTDGFYIECGAANGELISNSLFFEKTRNWSGLLVEANPLLFSTMLNKSRHAFMVNACLSPTNQSHKLQFRLADELGGLTNYMANTHLDLVKKFHPKPKIIEVQCFPLFSILRAIGVRHVDYFSLDIEGPDFEVLQTIPLDEISIDVISIEYLIQGDPAMTTKKLNMIKDYLGPYGYVVDERFPGRGLDLVMVKKFLHDS